MTDVPQLIERLHVWIELLEKVDKGGFHGVMTQIRLDQIDTLSDAAAALSEMQAKCAELTDKALRFDLDQLGITHREKEAVELVELRAKCEGMGRLLLEVKGIAQNFELEVGDRLQRIIVRIPIDAQKGKPT